MSMANIGRYEMYYNRTLSSEFSKLIEPGGKLRWLFKFVKNHNELDFLLGKNGSKQWISIYRGLTRILEINPTKDPKIIHIVADKKYKEMESELYGKKNINDNFETNIKRLVKHIENDSHFDRYYKNKKEGYYQNILSNKHGICGNPDTDFVIIDKEAVIGYKDEQENNRLLGPIQNKYKQMQKYISANNPKRYGKSLKKKAIGNELDFLALDKEGNILLIEYKHGTYTSGIYLSPLQIGLYYDIFTNFPREDLEHAIYDMLAQKKKIGLINPGWKTPTKLKEIIPVLIISEYSYRSSSKIKFDEILQLAKEINGKDFLRNLRTYNFTEKNGLSEW